MNVVVDIVVVRCKKNGEVSMARPCRSCLKVIKNVGVRFVFYTDWNGVLRKENAKDMIPFYVCAKERKMCI
jgi:hypothetical protein